MIDGSEKRNRQLAFELQNSPVCQKHSKNKKLHRNMNTTGVFPRSAGGLLACDWLVIFSVPMP